MARALGAAVLVIGVAGILSLLTWSVGDPSLTHATSGKTRNLLGPPGAIASDLLMQMLGIAGIFALMPVVYWSLLLVTRQRVPGVRTRVVTALAASACLAAALSSLPVLSGWPLRYGYGGLLGDFCLGLLTQVLAYVNPARAAAAAGLFTFAAGMALLMTSFGLSNNEVAALVSSSGRDRNRARRWFPFRLRRAPTGTIPAEFDGAHDPASAAAMRASRHEPTARYHPAATVPPAYCSDAYDRSYVAGDDWGGQASPPADARPPARAHSHQTAAPSYPSPHTGYPAPARPAFAAYSPPHSDLGIHGADRREPGFDAVTEAASRAVAMRFAPAAAVADVGAGTVASGPRFGAGFIAGLASGLRRPEPLYKRPSLNMLRRAGPGRTGAELTQNARRGVARLLADVLADFGIKGEIKDIRPGPVVTLYEFEPARGTKSSRVIGLADDIARSMSATAVRVAVVPGRNAIGIELPNIKRETVLLRDLIESEPYRTIDAKLPLALGKSIGGEPVVADLARMPHLLVAGTTGSGKSVGVNGMILSLLFRLAPEECRFIMIDPKMLELSVYNGIPHLLTPVVTDPAKAVAALNWVVSEMEERYKRMAQLNVRNIDVFNNRVKNARKRGEALARTVQTGFDPASGQAIYEQESLTLETMPYIVVVVDEFADLMAVAGKEIEIAVQRLAQMARAAGIHLIMATQRPSVDIITGTIKANFPTRISFRVASKIDSRTILNEMGAEQLLGQGDMLYSGNSGQVRRVHGPFVSDEEVEAVAVFLRGQGEPRYIAGITDAPDSLPAEETGGRISDDDIYDRAVAVVVRDQKASTSYVQRRLQIGYNRAADLIERMQQDGIVGPANHAGKRAVLLGGGTPADGPAAA